MLTIRDEQMLQLDAAQRQSFGEQTIAMLRAEFPQACAGFDDAELRGTVARALRKAREYGLTEQSDVFRYINVMYTLGCDFEDDPDYAWARAIMTHPRMRGGSKVDHLVERTKAHLRSLEEPACRA